MSAVEVIVLKKSFWGDERKFLEPLMRFARGGMRDHIVSHKNDHGASYRRYGVLPWRSRIKINFARFSASFDFRLLQHYPPKSGHPAANSKCPRTRKQDQFIWVRAVNSNKH